MSEESRFLKASEPDTWEKPDDIDTWGDYMLRPDKPLLQRHLELCRLAAHGKTNNEIAEKLGYTASRVSVLLGNTRIQAQINHYRDRLFQVDTKNRMKELAPDALNVIDGILTDESLSMKEKEKAAMWVIEKVDGKAAQQTDINVAGGIGFFLDKLDQMKAQGETINVQYSPTEIPSESSLLEPAKPDSELPTDEFTQWLDKNIKEDS